MEHTSGINVWHNGTKPPTIRIRYNRSKDIDGRPSDGQGGYQAGEIACNFIGFNSIRDADVEIAWNEEINFPYESLVEDSISTFESTGTPSHPINEHDNYVQGGYYVKPDGTFTGAGFNLGDAKGTGYVQCYRNQVVCYGNNGMHLSGGHDNHVYENRIVSSGYYPDSKVRLGYAASGIWVYNYYNDPSWTRNDCHDNVIGCYSTWFNERRDCSVNDAGNWNNVSLPGPITTATERNELILWRKKVKQNGIHIGPGLAPVARRVSGSGD